MTIPVKPLSSENTNKTKNFRRMRYASTPKTLVRRLYHLQNLIENSR